MTPPEILVVTGVSGAGMSTALKTLEDLGWEVVDNLPLALLDRLLSASPPAGAAHEARPLALGIGTRTRAFDADRAIELIAQLRHDGRPIELLFLDCASNELERRYDETRRRHPLAQDRPARDGLSEPTLTIRSFGFSRGLPGDADLVFDMRFLRNPHWDPALRPGTGLDPDVVAYIAEDPAYEEAVGRIEDLLLLLIPRYRAEGKAYVSIAIGCTGGKHRSVHVADRIARRLREAGFSPTVFHRDLVAARQDGGRPRDGSMSKAP